MINKLFKLSDKTNKVIGIVGINEIQNNVYIGKIRFTNFPKQLRELFSQYEKLINLQVFSLVDELEENIDKWELRLDSIEIYDIQIMNGDDISFKSSSCLILE